MTNKLFDDDLLEDDEIETVTIPEDEPISHSLTSTRMKVVLQRLFWRKKTLSTN